MSLVGASVQLKMEASEQITGASGNVDSHNASFNPSFTQLTDGTGINKAQKVGRKVFTLSTGNLDIDLTAFAGGINDAPINFSLVKQIAIKNLDAAINITYGGTAGAPANAWINLLNGTKILHPGEIRIDVDHLVGIAVNGTNKLLRATAASGTPQMEVVVIGEGV